MAFGDLIDKMLNNNDDYGDDYEEENLFENEDDAEEEPVAKKKKKSSAKKSNFGGLFSSASSGKNDEEEDSQIKVVLVRPKIFEEDTTEIAEHLCSHKTVVLNLELADRENSRRIIDFLMGTAYAVHGNIKQVANSTYIITPNNVDVLGELLNGDFNDNF